MNALNPAMSSMTPAGMGRVAVLCGGDGSERAVSLHSGEAVLAALQARGVNAFEIDGVAALVAAIQAGQVDRVFNILHGGAGENGEVQGLLAALNVPCSGCSLLGAALSMDKVRSKQLWQAQALPTADFHAHQRGDDLNVAAVIERLGLPVIVKPSREGSTVGITRVYKAEQMAHAVNTALACDEQILIEAFIQGVDVTVSILSGRALPSVRIQPASGFYDYHAKYEAEDTIYTCPGVADEEETPLRELAMRAFNALGCSGWGRVDFMRRDDGALFLLEVNTTPGMTSHSLVPMAAQAAGIDFEELAWRILLTS